MISLDSCQERISTGYERITQNIQIGERKIANAWIHFNRNNSTTCKIRRATTKKDEKKVCLFGVNMQSYGI